MIKVIGLMKRRPGMSSDDFRDYYENNHRVLAEELIGKYACKYVRNYLAPLEDENYGSSREPAFDCVMELLYPDQEAFEKATATLADPENLRINVADMEKLFDIEKCEFFTAAAYESALSPPG